jgi:hypothetical protein
VRRIEALPFTITIPMFEPRPDGCFQTRPDRRHVVENHDIGDSLAPTSFDDRLALYPKLARDLVDSQAQVWAPLLRMRA